MFAFGNVLEQQLHPKEAHRVLAGLVVFHLPQRLTVGRGASGLLPTTQVWFGGAILLLPLPTGPGKAPGFQLGSRLPPGLGALPRAREPGRGASVRCKTRAGVLPRLLRPHPPRAPPSQLF